MMRKPLQLLAFSLVLLLGSTSAWAQDGVKLMDMPKQRKPIGDSKPPTSTAKQPLTIIFVCDRSGSMEDDDKIEELNDALATFFKDLHDNMKCAILERTSYMIESMSTSFKTT